MHDDRAHAQALGEQAGVLAGGGAEAAQRVVGDVVAAVGGDLPDGARHVVDGHTHEVVGDPLRGARSQAGGAHRCGHLVDARQRGGGVDALVAAGAEHVREMLRQQLAEHDVAVGHGERAAAPVARRAGVGPGGARADPVAAVGEGADRAAPGRHGIDAQHRRAQADARRPSTRASARRRRRSARHRWKYRPCRTSRCA